jgi:hypothetical protein
MPNPFQFIPSSVLKSVLEHEAVDDVALGSPARNTELIVFLKADHPICKRLAPRRLGGGRFIINHYANGVRFNWKDTELNFQHTEFVGQHAGITAIQAEMYENIVDAAIDIINPPRPSRPFLGDIFLTQENFRRLHDHTDVVGYGVSHMDGRTSVAIMLKAESRYGSFFLKDRTTFEILFDATSVCFRWYDPNGVANWDSISATASLNVAELNSILGQPVAHMEKLLQYGVRAVEIEKDHDQKIANRRRAAFRAQFTSAANE